MALTKVTSGIRTLATDEVTTDIIEDGTVTNAKIKSDAAIEASKLESTLDLSGKTVTLPAASVTAHVTQFDDNQLKEEIALLGFRTAANGSLAKYNLVDQTIDAFEDATGVDASASTNESRDSSGKYYSGSAAGISGGTSSAFGATKTVRVFDTPGSMSMVVTGAGGNISAMLVGGGGGGGKVQNAGTAGGAGGVLWDQTLAITAQTYNFTIGAGGSGFIETPAGYTTQGPGTDGGDTVGFGGTAKGGGGGGGGTGNGRAGRAGGSGGGGGYGSGAGGAASQPTYSGFTAYAYAGGAGGAQGGAHGGGGGGGAGAVGTAGTTGGGGAGGNGWDGSGVFGTGVGDSGVFAGGGGGGGGSGPAASGGTGGGGDGRSSQSMVNGAPGTDGTGGGGGGGSVHAGGGDGGNGAIVIAYTTSDFEGVEDMTLISNATTAEAVPTKGDLVMTYSDGAGTATVNTDLKAYASRDDGTTWTQLTLASQGSTGAHTILTAHDLDISTQPSGTDMRYKLTTHNQSVTKQTRIHAVSLGWS